MKKIFPKIIEAPQPPPLRGPWTINNCELHPKKSIPSNVQWMRSVELSVLHLLFFMVVLCLFLFRPHQAMGVKRTLVLVFCFGYCLFAIYIIALQALGISHSKPSSLQLIPDKVILVISVCLQIYFLTNHFCIQRPKTSHVKFFFQMTGISISHVLLAVLVAQIIYPA